MMVTIPIVSFPKRPIRGLAASPFGAELWPPLKVGDACVTSVEDDCVSSDDDPALLDDGAV